MGDKHKMERWLRAGQSAVASVYAPIAYPPLPLLAFKVGHAQGHPSQGSHAAQGHPSHST